MSERLPVGWSSTRLGDIAFEVRNGISARPDGDAGTRILRISAVRPMLLNKGDTRFLSGPSTSWETYRLRTDDLLFTRYNGNPSLVGVCARVELSIDDVLVYPDKLIRVRLNERIGVPAFVEKAVHVGASRAFIEGKTKTSAGQVGISGSDLKDVPILLPPLNEQRRIVAKLEALQARSRRAREALDTVPALLEKLRQSILAAAFRGDLTKDWRAQHKDVEPASELLKRIRSERRKRWEESELAKLKAKGKPPTDDKWKAKYKEPDPVDTTGLPELPEGWCWASVDELLTALRNGISAKPDKDSGLRILRISAVRPLRVDINDVRFLAEDPAYDGYLLANGQLLLTRYNGNPELVGVAGVVRGLAEPTVYPDKLILATPLDTYIAADFLAIAFNTGATRRHIASKGKSAAGQVGISGSDIRGAPVPVPPIAEQLALVTAVQAGLVRIQAARSSAVQMAAMLSRLESAILAKAFRGELVPQDPNDEPADAMLARLARAGESGASA